jgi:holo-[acyl-carrier protein] synthase
MSPRTAEHLSSPALRVGVDLVRVADVTASIERFGARYTERVFTADEREYCDNTDVTRAAERYAARFAAKEATLKVLRPQPHDAIDPRSIEVRRLPEGACEIVLHDGAIAFAQRAGIADLSLSMSHEQEYATATVVACVAPSETPRRRAGDRRR